MSSQPPAWCVMLTEKREGGVRKILGMAMFTQWDAEVCLELLSNMSLGAAFRLRRAALECPRGQRVAVAAKLGSLRSQCGSVDRKCALLAAVCVLNQEKVDKEEVVARLRAISSGTLPPDTPVLVGK